MPELPEVETIRKSLEKELKNRTIVDVVVNYENIIAEPTVFSFVEQIKNQTIHQLKRYGKWLIFELDQYVLLSHLRMEGKYFFRTKEDPISKHEHVIFCLDDDRELRYHDTRKFGRMYLLKKEEAYDVPPLSKLGLEPWDSLLTVTYLKEKLKNKTIPIKTCLLDQSIIVGIGNIYANEILFLSRISPLKKSNCLTKKELERIIENTRTVLKEAIEMVPDEEGFLYPKVNKEKCIKCGKCKKVCPVLNNKNRDKFKQKGYIFQYKDKEIRKQSTSGGAFTAIADYVIERNGVVFGAAFDKNFNVVHQSAKNKEDLEKFRNSKYVQSDLKNTFKEVKELLENNILVCYSGTACQIEGLISYLGKKYDNLITVDVICRAVPSPMLWKKYLEYRIKNNNPKKIYFREKFYGYKYSNLTMRDNSKVFYHNGVDTDPYLRAFFSNIAVRPSCYNCKFKEQLHKADFTIWDCFDVDKYDSSFDDDIGTTRVLLNSEKAIKIFDEIKLKHNTKEVEVGFLVSNFHQMFNSVKYNSKRKEFFDDLKTEDFESIISKYFPNSFKCKIEKYARIALIKLRIYKPLVRLGKKVRKRI